MGFFSKNILTKDELDLIAKTISEVEKTTIGEVRVQVQKRRAWKDRYLPVYDLALKNFHELGMNNTKDKTGVLVFLLISDQKFQIIGDEGIHKKVTKEFWDVLALKMIDYFRQNKFADGIIEAVKQIGEVLAREFPMKAGDTNELSNDVIIS